MTRSAFVMVATLAAVGCGDSANGVGGGTYAAKCAAACTPAADGPCVGQDPTACRGECEAATEGMTAVCAQCLAEHTSWHSCSSDTCYDQYGNPYACGVFVCPEGAACGYTLGSLDDCNEYCAPSGDGGVTG